MEKIKIGQIVNVVGLRGELKIYNYSDSQERYLDLYRVIVDNKEYQVENIRFQKNMVIAKLEGITNRNDAEAMKEKFIYITEDDLMELPDDTFYVRDLIGMNIIDIETGKNVGTLENVIQNTSQDVYEIKREEEPKVLVPAVLEFIKNIDMEKSQITIKFIEGML